MRDIVYLVGPGERNDQLQYSLRSIRNLPHDRVWIVGHKPEWAHGVEFLPVSQRGPKHANTWRNLEMLARRGPESFYLFNDDYFVLHPMRDVPVYHRGSLDERIAYYNRKPGLGSWAARGRHTRRAFELLGRDPAELLTYELHLPMPLNREAVAGAVEALHRVRELDSRFYMKRTLIGNWARLGGQRSQDCKVHSKWGNATLRGQFLSTSDAAWAGSTGAALRIRFPEPSEFERSYAKGRGGRGRGSFVGTRRR